MRIKPSLFTIHGIYTDGEWQSGAATVLEPFFRHYPLKYSEYRHLAILKLAADVITIIVAVFVALVLQHLGVLNGKWLYLLYLLLVCIVAVSWVHGYASRYRNHVMMNLYDRITNVVGNGPRPFIIAHSLGIYLLGRALRYFEYWSCHTMILTGCVLRRTFPWSTLKHRFHYVSNEVARADMVPIGASLLSIFVPDMGCSGTFGFRGEPGNVHNVLGSESWGSAKGDVIETCSILTTTPNAVVADVHRRMPAILKRDDYPTWLHPDIKNPSRVSRCLEPFDAALMKKYPVSTRVNRPENDDHECAQEIAVSATLTLF